MTEKKNSVDSSSEATQGKGRATPPRKQQEAANRRPLVGGTTPEARKASKQRQTEERQRARAGVLAGEEKYLTVRDRGPQRRLARDLVDSRFTVGELMVPILFVSLVLTSIPMPTTEASALVQVIAVLLMWAILIGMVVDGFFLGRTVQKRVAEKFGADKVERGLRMYAAMRAINMRVMRLPKPQVKRGTKI
jgi:hypothetical protein